VLATQHLLEAVRPTPDKRFVYASSSSVYGNAETYPTAESVVPRPFSPYGVTKLAGEHLCSQYHDNFGLQTVSLRFFTVYGPRQRPDMAFARFAAAALNGEPMALLGDGGQRCDLTYVADACARRPRSRSSAAGRGAVYNVAGGRSVALAEVFALLGSGSGASRRSSAAPPTAASDLRAPRRSWIGGRASDWPRASSASSRMPRQGSRACPARSERSLGLGPIQEGSG